MTIRRRPAVNQFSIRMEKKLRENDHRVGWHTCTDLWLLRRLFDELLELQKAIFTKKSSEAIAEECADVANFAMMIADNALREDTQ